MKAHLLYRDDDFDFAAELPPDAADLTQDLDLTTLFEAMARGDPFLFAVSTRVVLSSLTDPVAIGYRQDILTDCIAQPAAIREIYALAVAAIEGEHKVYRGFHPGPSAILRRSIEVLELFMGLLRRLRRCAADQDGKCRSQGLTTFCSMVLRELDDEYFAIVGTRLRQLKFSNGALISVRLGQANKGVDYVLRTPGSTRRPWRELIGIGERSSYSFEIAARDDAGAKALTELRDRGINLVANAVAQSVDHILSFFAMLRSELGFYVSCLNLYERLGEKGEPTCTPATSPRGTLALSASGLYDVGLTLRMGERVVGNDLYADGRLLVMITGANSGGKSTFLRSMGVAHLMMQCGMFVGARSFKADLRSGIFTHFIREEDAQMSSGRLDEELARMSGIADRLTTGSLVLFNESFSATNEREGSEIARQVVRALLDAGVKVFFVTHLFDLAGSLRAQRADTAVFLRAEREIDGRRSFRLEEGEPLPTSYGLDIYDRLGGWARAPEPDSSAVGP